MTKEQIKEYTARVAQANRTELVVIIYEIALQLRQLYSYVNEQLISTLVQRRPVHLDAACEVIRGLMESFEQVAKEDHSGPVMEHSQQLYAGLTYGKGTLNEVSLGEGSTYGGKI